MLPVFITGNQHKVNYLSRILGLELEHVKLDLDEIQSTDPQDVIEHKAKQAYAILQRPVMVEDTSLVFEAWGELPGPFVKFFVEAENGLEKMCRMLDGFDNRAAYGAVIYGCYDGEELVYFAGKSRGVIADHPRGTGGYGWDPIFIPQEYNGLTRAELSSEQDLENYLKFRDVEGLKQYLAKKSVS